MCLPLPVFAFAAVDFWLSQLSVSLFPPPPSSVSPALWPPFSSLAPWLFLTAPPPSPLHLSLCIAIKLSKQQLIGSLIYCLFTVRGISEAKARSKLDFLDLGTSDMINQTVVGTVVCLTGLAASHTSHTPLPQLWQQKCPRVLSDVSWRPELSLVEDASCPPTPGRCAALKTRSQGLSAATSAWGSMGDDFSAFPGPLQWRDNPPLSVPLGVASATLPEITPLP